MRTALRVEAWIVVSRWPSLIVGAILSCSVGLAGETAEPAQTQTVRLPVAESEEPAAKGDKPAAGTKDPVAEAEEPAAEPEDPVRAAERSARLDLMRGLVRGVEVTVRQEGKVIPIPPPAEPLFRYGDNARDYVDGSIWAWGEKGRPYGMITVAGRGVPGSGEWTYEFNLLRPVELSSTFDGLWWRPLKTEVKMEDLPKAPAPADTEAKRLLQMKQLLRRFECFEYWQDFNRPGAKQERYELRGLPRPIHRYSEMESGTIDGALFLASYGTNPELVLILEASKEKDEIARWRCGFTRLAFAEVHVLFDGVEIWKVNQIRAAEWQDGYCLLPRPWRVQLDPPQK